ncbi:hypothetical protein SUGI_0604290 [Cryptomeria japonica]|nr:hypothetical protein SUGI_0604290 [Cryptomeria japonica]
MASTSTCTCNPQLEELSGRSSTPAFDRYEPPTAKLAFESDKSYHVFLSFRGEDVRKTLVDHLFEALSTAGLNVFLDSEKLEKGEIIGESLERAIGSSAIRIPIFSKGYAESAWCLKEAAAMLTTPGLIIPLFYYVNPTHVRYPVNVSSPYRQAFMKHYGHSARYPVEEIDGWKDALEKICSRSGWSMDITQGCGFRRGRARASVPYLVFEPFSVCTRGGGGVRLVLQGGAWIRWCRVPKEVDQGWQGLLLPGFAFFVLLHFSASFGNVDMVGRACVWEVSGVGVFRESTFFPFFA